VSASKKEFSITSALLPPGEAVAAELASLSTPPNTFAAIFPDPALAQAVADLWRVPVTTRVTQTDLDRVQFLEADDRGITDLAGMEFLRSLQGVDLNRNRIRDLGPLSGLQNLELLTLDDNQISNLQPLAGLSYLDWLWLDDNEISNLQPLAGLTNLGWLTLVGNQVQDISPLSELRNTYSLWLNENRISDLRPLAELTQLEGLWLDGNQIADLRPLAGLTNLWDFESITEVDDFMLGLWVGEQNMTRPTVVQTNPLVLENPLFHPNGTRIAPSQISHGGTYAAPNLRWAGLPANTAQVTYTFIQSITIGSATDLFYGTVEQPLSVTPFTDVRRGDWFHDAVAFVFGHEIINGTTATTFDPDGPLSRAMMVTVLYRMEGEPAVTGQPAFADVPPDTWFSDAILWAYDQEIVQGVAPGMFAPERLITRQEVATILHRYAQITGENITVPAGVQLAQFTDRDAVSDWAWEAMRWSVHNGLVTGATPTTMNPQGTATRAECATFLMRYIQRFG